MSTSGTAAPTGLFSNSRGLGFNRSVKYQAGNANSCNEINHKVTWPGYEANIPVARVPGAGIHISVA